MKIVIASDIHGSLYYTQKLDEYINKVNPDQIILLGDFFASYDYDLTVIDEVARLLNNHANKTIAVKGNCDGEFDINKLLFGVIPTYEIINIDGIDFYITHGHLNSKYSYLFDNHYLISGHTHIYNLEGMNLNPGSVGLPRMHKEHTCLFYENNCFNLINLEDFSTIESKKINK